MSSKQSRGYISHIGNKISCAVSLNIKNYQGHIMVVQMKMSTSFTCSCIMHAQCLSKNVTQYPKTGCILGCCFNFSHLFMFCFWACTVSFFVVKVLNIYQILKSNYCTYMCDGKLTCIQKYCLLLCSVVTFYVRRMMQDRHMINLETNKLPKYCGNDNLFWPHNHHRYNGMDLSEHGENIDLWEVRFKRILAMELLRVYASR